MGHASSAVIRLDRFRQNLEAIRRRIPAGTLLCPAVKANGYGHGVELLLPVLAETGTEALAVAQLEEAAQLRQLGWRRRILCLGAPVTGQSESDCRERAEWAVRAGIECSVSSGREVELLGQAASRLLLTAKIQIKVDTGMGRMGVLATEAAEWIPAVSRTPCVAVAGVYTHFATADEPGDRFALEQLGRLRELRDALMHVGCTVPAWHAANSAAVFSVPGSSLDMVRPGLAIYGYWGGRADGRPGDLRPILRWTSHLVSVRPLPAGSSVGYGRTFRAARDSLVGIVPIGYADGYRRGLSNVGVMTLEARRTCAAHTLPVVGRVSMDTVCLDLTGVPDVRVGDPVTVLDDRPDAPNSVESVAQQLGTIPYEITCGIGPRVRRVADVTKYE